LSGSATQVTPQPLLLHRQDWMLGARRHLATGQSLVSLLQRMHEGGNSPTIRVLVRDAAVQKLYDLLIGLHIDQAHVESRCGVPPRPTGVVHHTVDFISIALAAALQALG